MKAISSVSAIALCLSIAAIAAYKDTTVPRSESVCQVSGITLTGSMDSRVPASTKKVVVLLKLQNNSKRELYTTGGSGFHIEVLTHDGRRVAHTLFGESEAEDGKPTILHPGQSEQFDYDIRSRFQIDKPDLYKVIIKFNYNDQDDNGWGQLEVSVPFLVGNPPTPWKQPAGGI